MKEGNGEEGEEGGESRREHYMRVRYKDEDVGERLINR